MFFLRVDWLPNKEVAWHAMFGSFVFKFEFSWSKDRWRLTSSPWIAMDTLKEFLESSTIHGLAYISTEKVNVHIIFQVCSTFIFRRSQQRFFGLLLSALGSLVLGSWLASRTRSGRRIPLPPQSPPTPSTTLTSPLWPSVLQRTLTQPSTMILSKLAMDLSLMKTEKH